MRTSWLTFLALLTLTLIAAPVQTAYACSGGPPPLSINYLMQHSLVVKATVVETDDASINAILRVDSYLNGGNGDQYLLYQRNDPVLSAVYVGHGYGTGCAYSGAERIQLGMTSYFALERHADGSYHTVDELLFPIFPIYPLPFTETRTVYVLADPASAEGSGDNLTPVEVASEEAFLAVLREYGEVNIVPPDEEQQFRPLLAPLLITTETGAQYQLPVDRREPLRLGNPVRLAAHPANAYPDLYNSPPYCAEVGCRLSTPDYSLYAEQTDAETISMGVPYGDCVGLQVLPGQAFAFSSTSESMLVWNADHLDVYLIQSRMAGGDITIAGFSGGCGMGNTPQLWPIFSIPLTNGRIGEAEWSADGNVLAYADGQGLWSLDLWRGLQSELVVSGDRLFPLFVSATGRYIGYQTDQASSDWLTLDTRTGETFENALVSDNERRFALLEPTYPTEQRDRFTCAQPITLRCPLIFETFPNAFGWFNGDDYFIAQTTPWPDWYSAYTGAYGLIEGGGQIEFNRDRFSSEKVVLDIAYEPHQGTFALLMGEYEIRLNNQALDLSGSLDGAITQITWLPPLFYFAE